MTASSELERWARSNGIDLGVPLDAAMDFGRFEERVPAYVLRPRSVGELCACVRFLAAAAMPFVSRGTAHSNGGQVLTAGGVVIDLRRLSRIVDDAPEQDEITVEGGATWLSVFEHLAPQRRRPLVLTDNLATTVGGTLAVGGFGDTSHLYGLQAEHVTAIELVTPTGELVTLTPRDELFRFVMCGRGQLGVIATATLRTCRRPPVLVARRLRWRSLEDFVSDAVAIAEYRLFEYLRARVRWEEETMFVDGLAGHFAESPPAEDRTLRFLRPVVATGYDRDDLLTFYRLDRSASWTYACPALELVYPLPEGLDVFGAAQPRLRAAGIPQHIPIGASLVVTPRAHSLPLAPSPDSNRGLMVALRPQMTREDARARVPILREIATESVRRGAKLYLMGIEPPPHLFLREQYGAALPRLLALKRQLDPASVCNRGLLEDTCD